MEPQKLPLREKLVKLHGEWVELFFELLHAGKGEQAAIVKDLANQVHTLFMEE